MNERSIAQSLLRRIELHARRRHASQVRRIAICVGELSGADAELLASTFAALRERTVCHSAILDVRRVEARWACPSCSHAIARGAALRCERCGAVAALVDGGDVVLERIDIAVAT